MLKKFFNGFVFGSGFFVAVGLLGWLLASALITPPIGSDGKTIYFGSSLPGAPGATNEVRTELLPSLHDLPLEKQIERATVIVVTRFEDATDGRKKAVIAEILKHAPGTRFQYAVGDEYPSASYYPRDNVIRGDGTVVFFEGASADMRYSVSVQGERVSGLGDIPMKLFREKCNQSKG
ncbi:hypothetical protein [Acidovorax sp.]|uniref:hypothetical protein n=1 Tax=Acidovorax sp. TaxID=1872122 RepID=UPI00263A2B25|nr:hypothetical protein [Acidovorax sp.]